LEWRSAIWRVAVEMDYGWAWYGDASFLEVGDTTVLKSSDGTVYLTSPPKIGPILRHSAGAFLFCPASVLTPTPLSAKR